VGKRDLAYTIRAEERLKKELDEENKKIRQQGISRPAASTQKYILLARLNLAPPSENMRQAVSVGLGRLCRLFQRIDQGMHKINILENESQNKPLYKQNRHAKLSEFKFSATIGFGLGFFKKLDVDAKRQPRKLREMPDHDYLGDPTPYSIGQTDLIIQLCSSEDFVNRWVLENSIQPPLEDVHNEGRHNIISSLRRENLETPDIVTAITGWATITDINVGFQRVDGRNLQGFNDGVSNPRRLSPLFDEIVWTKIPDDTFKDGTYMVFQKIEHDLDQWRELELDEQEEWVGRSKGTGLLIGTLDEEKDRELDRKLNDPTANEEERRAALEELHKHFDSAHPERDQSNPLARFFDHKDPYRQDSLPKYGEIPLKCPVWSHVRKANPRQEDSLRNGSDKEFPSVLIFRRGYLYMEKGLNEKIRSGLLFVCFQNDISNGFEYIKKNFLNNKNFPVPEPRKGFTSQEIAKRSSKGRFTKQKLYRLTTEEKKLLGLGFDKYLDEAKKEASLEDTQNTGREGLAGPSELGVNPSGEFLAIVPLGGGYYFVPPIPDKDISKIGQQFFE
jgi:Dyp-type peroxidase family